MCWREASSKLQKYIQAVELQLKDKRLSIVATDLDIIFGVPSGFYIEEALRN